VTGNFPGQFNYDYIVANGVCAADTSNALIVVEDCIWVGLDEPISNEIYLYPNPTDKILNVSFSNPIPNYLVNITDLNGRLIYSEEIKKNLEKHFEIDVEKMLPGVYFMNVIDSSKRTVFRFIKK